MEKSSYNGNSIIISFPQMKKLRNREELVQIPIASKGKSLDLKAQVVDLWFLLRHSLPHLLSAC